MASLTSCDEVRAYVYFNIVTRLTVRRSSTTPQHGHVMLCEFTCGYINADVRHIDGVGQFFLPNSTHPTILTQGPNAIHPHYIILKSEGIDTI